MKLVRLLPTLAAFSGAVTVAQAADAAPFIAALRDSFAAWDADHNGTLAKVEVDKALADPAIKGDAAAALAAVKRVSRNKDWDSVKLTVDDLSRIAAAPHSKNMPDLADMFADGRERIKNMRPELFTEGAPGLRSLHQGAMGNCFSLAPLGSMLDRDANQVKAMFKENPDGTYEVKIGGRAVHVTAPTEAEVALSSSNDSTGLWSNVYEKAAGVARNELREEKDRVTTPLDAIARGGSAGTMLAFITGNPMERFTLKWAKDSKTTPEEAASKLAELRIKLKAAFATHRCVTTGTLKPLMPGLRGGHAYGVIGYDEATDEIHTWDPHGDDFAPAGTPGPTTGFPRQRGVCVMPLKVFTKQFAGLAFELVPAAQASQVNSQGHG